MTARRRSPDARFRFPLGSIGLALAVIAGMVNIGGGAAQAVEIERVRGDGGVEAWLVEDHTLPIIAVSLAFRGGAVRDPLGKEGLAEMVSALLDEGAGGLDSQAFQGRLEDLAISLRFDAGLDRFGGFLKTLTENKEEAFELLRLALTAPRFDAEPVERMRDAILAQHARNAEDPDYIAARTWWGVAFPNHPYGRPVAGTPATIAAITIDDLRSFVAQRLARDNMVIGVVGDISSAELQALLDRTFGELPARVSPQLVMETWPQAVGELFVVPKEIPQSVVAFGQIGVKRDDADYYAAYVMNYVLGGGGFSSRLYEEVREKRGLAYSVYSYLNPMDHVGLILGGVATKNDQVKNSIELIRAEWARMASEGISTKELAAAQAFLTGSFPLRLDSTSRIARILVAIQLEYLGFDYLDRRDSYIESVTTADVARVAGRLLDADGLTFVVVGAPTDLSGKPAPR